MKKGPDSYIKGNFFMNLNMYDVNVNYLNFTKIPSIFDEIETQSIKRDEHNADKFKGKGSGRLEEKCKNTEEMNINNEQIYSCFFDNSKKKTEQPSNAKSPLYNVKEYKCTAGNCVKTYKSRENLTLHVKNIHENLKPYSCRFCKCTFSHRNGK